MHTLLDLRGNIPAFVHLTDGKVHDVNVLDQLVPEAGAFYVMDRAYIDFERLFESACNAITSDWQANGRIAVDAPASAVPIAPHDSALPTASAPSQPAAQVAPVLPQQPKLDTVAIVMHTTASADKYCKPLLSGETCVKSA